MQYNILIGGAAGQGINLVSKIVSNMLAKWGYYTFNYRDYQSLIRGGHNFNVLSFSDVPLESHAARMDILVALDKRTVDTHRFALKKNAMQPMVPSLVLEVLVSPTLVREHLDLAAACI